MLEMEFVEERSVSYMLDMWQKAVAGDTPDYLVMSENYTQAYGFDVKAIVAKVRWCSNRSRKYLRKMHAALKANDGIKAANCGLMHAKYAALAGDPVQFWPADIGIAQTDSALTQTITFNYGA